MRVVNEADEPQTPEERCERFAINLDRLIVIVGLSRKDAAREIGIAYKLMRRLVSAGVRTFGSRNTESLKKIADYFALPSFLHLWRADLLRGLLTTDEGSAFVEKFRPRLLAERERRVGGARVVGHEELVLLGRVLGVEESEHVPLTGPNANKVASILASPKGDNFQRVIDDYYELALRHVTSPDAEKGG
jgi:hypothetical protein